MLNWPSRHLDQHHLDWIIRQLDLQPHQHLLEAGCGSGRLLSAVARKLHNSFLAATEPSITLFRQAVHRNSTFLRQDSLQLHLGQLQDLPYPAGYFHTIYGSGSYYTWKNLLTECLRLTYLLRGGGRLIMLSHPGRYRKEDDLRTEAARLQAAFLNAGLTEIRTEYKDFPPGTCLAITGTRATQQFDLQQRTSINNRLLNSTALFISK